MIFASSRFLWAFALLFVLVQVSTFAQTTDGDNGSTAENISPEPAAQETPDGNSSPSADIISPEPAVEVTSENPSSQTEAVTDDSAVDAKIDKIIAKVRAAIDKVVNDLRSKLDGRLEEIFPELKEKIKSLHGNIDACYDATIGKNVTVNIFQSKVHDTVKKFLSTHGEMLKGMDHEMIHKRVKSFLGNLAVLVDMLVKCVEDKEKGLPTMKLGLTPLSIYSEEEYRNKILNNNLISKLSRGRGRKPRKHVKRSPDDVNDEKVGDIDQDPDHVPHLSSSDICSPHDKSSADPLPKAFDWRNKGKVTKVYNQLECGSCYVYATTSALESSYLIAANKTVRGDGNDVQFSVQATLNCMPNGCGGGNLPDPLTFFESHGVTNYENAPYRNRNAPCDKSYPIALKARSHCFATNLNEEKMQRNLMAHGPAAVAIDGHGYELAFLKDSPYLGHCGKDLSHAVLLVGWDEKYWIIKNSWSDSWGINGFLYLPRGENKCGVQMMYGVPIVDPIKSDGNDEDVEDPERG